MKCKKLTALLLTAAMAASVLTGCGGEEAASSTGTSEPAETSGGGKIRRRLPVKTAIKKLLISRCL